MKTWWRWLVARFVRRDPYAINGRWVSRQESHFNAEAVRQALNDVI